MDRCCPEGSEFHIAKSSIPLSSCDDADAQFNLGVMYYKSRGVPQDYLQAHVWANLGASSARSGDGHPSASSRPRRNFDNSGALNRREPSAILPDGGPDGDGPPTWRSATCVVPFAERACRLGR